MAKSLKIGKYRGHKINPDKNVVLHVSNKKGEKYHIRFEWEQWVEFCNDITTPTVARNPIIDRLGQLHFEGFLQKGQQHERDPR